MSSQKQSKDDESYASSDESTSSKNSLVVAVSNAHNKSTTMEPPLDREQKLENSRQNLAFIVSYWLRTCAGQTKFDSDSFSPLIWQFAVEDWSKKTDFHDVPSIGYLCDNGEVIEGYVEREHKETARIFIHFSIYSAHFRPKYAWLDTPNERIRPPPKNLPHQNMFEFPQ